jgi:hypothetical protein
VFIAMMQIVHSQVPSYISSTGLVGYWPFNGNANDESGNNNNGTINGATLTTDRFGNANSAYSFNGVSDFINIVNSSSLNPTTSITICGWIKSRSTNSFDRIINKSHNIAQNYATYQLITRNASLNATPGFTLRFGTGNSQTTSDYSYSGDNIGNVYFDTWQFIVGTWDGTTMKFYQNGILISTISRTGLLNYTNGDLQFGKGTGGTGLPQFYKGEIDDIGIWNRALTQAEITAMYNGVIYSDSCNSVSGPLAQGLVGYWPFCGNANDESGNGNNGTVNGATLTSDRFGNSNSAYSFDGTSNYIRIDNTLLSNNPNSYSISVWYNTQNFTTQNGNSRMLISDRNTGLCSYKYTMTLTPSGHSLSGVIYNCTSPNGNSVTGEAGIDNNWHNAIYIYDNSIATIFLYIDGVLTNTTTNVNQWSNRSNPTNIGYWNGFVGASGYFDGKIDDIGIWNRVLTQQEITDLFNNNLTTNSFVNNESLINIYPNPTNSQIRLDCGNRTDLIGSEIRITNMLGQELYNSVFSQQIKDISLSSIATSGMYFVCIINNEGKLITSKKIILQ